MQIAHAFLGSTEKNIPVLRLEMRCFGITKKFRRCKRNTKFLFCADHRFQFISIVVTLIGILGSFASIYSIKQNDIYNNKISIIPEYIETINLNEDCKCQMSMGLMRLDIPQIENPVLSQQDTDILITKIIQSSNCFITVLRGGGGNYDLFREERFIASQYTNEGPKDRPIPADYIFRVEISYLHSHDKIKDNTIRIFLQLTHVETGFVIARAVSHYSANLDSKGLDSYNEAIINMMMNSYAKIIKHLKELKEMSPKNIKQKKQ